MTRSLIARLHAARTRSSARVRTFLVAFAAVWLVGLVVRVFLQTAITGSPWPNAPLGWYERLGLFCYGSVTRVPGDLLIALCITAAGAARASNGWRGTLGLAVSWGLAFALYLFGFASWASFYGTGQFLNAETWRLGSSSPVLLLAHVMQIAPLALIIVPLSALGVLVSTARFCAWCLAWPPARARLLVRAVAGVIVAATGMAWSAEVQSAHDARRVAVGPGSGHESALEAWTAFASDRSGAFARVEADIWNAATGAEARRFLAHADAPQGAPLLAWSEYVHRAAAGRPRRLSVVIAFVESLRADELTVLGGRRVVMPALEALAREATVYSDAIAPAAQTDYATTSVLASAAPLRHASFEAFPDHIAYPRVLLHDVLHAVGYRTAIFSSQNEHWAGMYNFLATGGVEHFMHAENYRGPTYEPELDRGFRHWMASTGHAGKLDDRRTIDEAIAWVDTIAPADPFFAYVNLQTSHTPYQRPRGFVSRFGTGRVSFPILFDVYPADSAQPVRDMYDNSLAYADEQLGRLVAALKRDGRWNSTILVVLGDHGEAFYEHGFGAHGSELYREVTHVPLVVRIPGASARRDSLPAAGIDIAPTLLALLGLPPHPAFQGSDLADTTGRRARPVFTLTQTALADEVAVEQNGWKLLYELRHERVQLFDLRNDPGELRDVSESRTPERTILLANVAAWWTTQLAYYRSLPADAGRYPPLAPPALVVEAPARLR